MLVSNLLVLTIFFNFNNTIMCQQTPQHISEFWQVCYLLGYITFTIAVIIWMYREGSDAVINILASMRLFSFLDWLLFFRFVNWSLLRSNIFSWNVWKVSSSRLPNFLNNFFNK